MYIFVRKKRKYSYFTIAFQFDESKVDKVRKIPSSDYDPKTSLWEVRVSRETAPYILKLIQEDQFECSDEVLDIIREILHSKDHMLSLSRAENARIDLPEFPNDLKPYAFQKAGSKYMIQAKRCFNGDDMGTGKTIQTLIAMEVADAYPHIVICPSVSVPKWRKEAVKWLPHRSSAILNDDNYSYGHDIMIINYEAILKFLVREERRFDKKNRYIVRNNIKSIGLKGLTCDESHYVKRDSSKRTKAVRSLSKGVEYRWLLSGTIVENRPKEFIPQLQILDRLNDFGGYTNFIRQYCDAEFDWTGHINKNGALNLTELNKKLRQTCMIRRKKKEVIKELPPKTRQNIRVDIDNMDEYKLAQNDIFDWMENNRRKKEGNLNLFDDLEDRIDHRRYTEDAIELQIINALKLITARGKLKHAIKWIKRFLKTGKKLVVFAHHREIHHGILKAFPGSAKIIGGMTPSERDRNERIFRETEYCNLIVCALKSANVTLDLPESHTTITVELGWTASVHDQAEDRCWRLGQHHTCTNYYLLGRNVIDEDIYDLIQTKRHIADASLNGDKSAEDTNIYNELVERLKKKGTLKIPESYESDRVE